MMDDDDVVHAMRRADSAQSALDAPLSLRAEADLARIVSGPSSGSTTPITRTSSQSSRRWRWITIPVFAAVLVVAIAVTVNLVPMHLGAPSAEAVTPPLLVGNHSGMLWVDAMRLAGTAASTAIRAGGESTRGSVYSAWYLNTDVGVGGKAISYVSPQEVTFTWNADLSGRIKQVAGAPVAPARGGVANDASAPSPGTILSDEAFSQDQIAVKFADAPPTDAVAMGLYIEKIGDVSAMTDPVQVLDEVQSLLNEWTLSPQSRVALFAVLESLPDVSGLGHVTDRLGRTGEGYIAKSPIDPRFSIMVVVNVGKGQILSIEKVYLGGVIEYKNINPPAVISYVAWKEETPR